MRARIKHNFYPRFVKLNASFTNIFDHTNYADPVTNLTSGSFGKSTRVADTEFGGARTGGPVSVSSYK